MLRWQTLLRTLLVLSLIVVLGSCGEDNDEENLTDLNDTSGTTAEFPEAAVVTLPESVVQNAPEVLAFQAYGNSLATWSNYVAGTGEEIDGGTQWTYTDSATGEEVVVKAVSTDGGTQWTVQVNGVTRWVGETSQDGNTVQWTAYDPTGQTVQATYTAQKNADGSFSFELNAGEVRYQGQVNPDGSGSLKLEANGQTTMEVQWNADGSGTRKIYGPNGQVIAEQSW